jgi:hypothetical protein
MTGIATATVAGPSGSDARARQAFRKRQSRRIPAAFQWAAAWSKDREKSLALLDNRGGLC